jgi:hypothetical protein
VLRRFQNIFQAQDAQALLASPEIAGIEPVYVEVPRGGVAFHAGLRVHMAKPNRTDTDRAVHTVIMFADGCTRSSRHFHPSVDRDGVRVGEAIRGACTPIVWPRGEGDFPTPPLPVPTAVSKLAPIGVLPTRE